MPDPPAPQDRAAFRSALRKTAYDLPSPPAVTEPGETAISLLEEALHLRQNGERAPGGNETWRDWDRRAEVFLRDAARNRALAGLWAARCELSPEVMREMGDEALAAHLRDAHPGESG